MVLMVFFPAPASGFFFFFLVVVWRVKWSRDERFVFFHCNSIAWPQGSRRRGKGVGFVIVVAWTLERKGKSKEKGGGVGRKGGGSVEY